MLFIKIDSHPASQELFEYGQSLCPVDAHIHITVHGTWGAGTDGFGGRSKSDVTTRCQVVRVFSVHGVTHWTLENWAHDNGYRCELVILTKSEFLALIRS